LGGKRFVMRHDECRSIEVGNDICHCERFARTGNAIESLHFLPGLNTVDQRRYRLRLIARWLEGGVESEPIADILPQETSMKAESETKWSDRMIPTTVPHPT
jgi:hypothetical protein